MIDDVVVVTSVVVTSVQAVARGSVCECSRCISAVATAYVVAACAPVIARYIVRRSIICGGKHVMRANKYASVQDETVCII